MEYLYGWYLIADKPSPPRNGTTVLMMRSRMKVVASSSGQIMIECFSGLELV